MLKKTFCHVPGIGPKRERWLWQSGFRCWEDCDPAKPLPLSREAAGSFRRYVEASGARLAADDPGFFAGLLPQSLLWRLFPEFRHATAYLDIETTGSVGWESPITTVSVYDGASISCYVQGDNLEAFPEDISRYKVLVTYNGRCFDLPILERHFGTRFPHVHIDLRFVLKSLGIGGGLKRCERQMGIDRGLLDGVDGFFAVLLWQEYASTGDPRALETLLAYNIQDVVNLEALMISAYNLKLGETPFGLDGVLPAPVAPELPYAPDPETIERVRRRITSWEQPY
ncbi:MAG: ribonuclease H-like domain-containing protein [bacterium]